MSHIIEEYSKCLGVKPGRPILSDHFYPIPHDYYITTDFDINGESDTYKYWEVVFYLINKFYPGLKVIDLSNNRSAVPHYAESSIRGELSYRQISYVISNSRLHLCNNLFSSHLSSFHKVPTVCLFGSLLPANNKPYFSDNVKCISYSGDIKPSYSSSDPNDLINKINPEDIASSCLNFLDINHDLLNYQTIYIGKYYNSKILEIIPDFKPSEDFNPDKIVNIRYDYCNNDVLLEPWLQYKCNIMCEEMIDFDLVKTNADKISGMTIFLNGENFSSDYISKIQKLNINFSLICKNKKEIKKQRLKFFDWDVDEFKEKSKKDLDLRSKLCNNMLYDSSKQLFSEGRAFSSKLHWKKHKNKESFSEVIDCPLFWEEAEHMNIYSYGGK